MPDIIIKPSAKSTSKAKLVTVVAAKAKRKVHWRSKNSLNWKLITQMTPLEKVAIANKRISKTELEQLKRSTELDYSTLSNILSISRATLINKKGNEKFAVAQSERIFALADIYAYGYEVFEDKDKFNHWINESNKALGGQKPLELLNSQFGKEEVKRLIGRIDYGVYS
jgi:putative toxin-antitoxin system antitoxin component (TIGR02293 family)